MSEEMNLARSSSCTVILPCTGSYEATAVTLQSILSQEVEEAEVIVSCNGMGRKEYKDLKRHLRRRIKSDIAQAQSEINAQRAMNGQMPIRFVYSHKAGKAHALNIAIRYASYDIICIVDADCRFKGLDALTRLLYNMTGDVIAAGGRIVVDRSAGGDISAGNRTIVHHHITMLQKIQQVEYNRTFMLLRPALSYIRAVNLVSGAFGAFTKAVVTACGGYDETFVGEDMELTLRMQRYCRAKHIPYSVIYDPRAVIYTSVPTSVHRLFRQRDRWQRGLVGSYLKNISLKRDMAPAMRYIVMNYMLIFGIGTPYFAVAGLLRQWQFEHILLIIALWLAAENVFNIIAELRRRHLDGSLKDGMSIFEILLLTPVSMLAELLLLIPARLYGNITYAWRKDVW